MQQTTGMPPAKERADRAEAGSVRAFLMDPLNLTRPSGKLLHNYGKSPFLMGKLTVSMTIFNSYFDITRGYHLS